MIKKKKKRKVFRRDIGGIGITVLNQSIRNHNYFDSM